jgi:hypothetical protein
MNTPGGCVEKGIVHVEFYLRKQVDFTKGDHQINITGNLIEKMYGG